jgi:hypothetical protein
VPQSVDTADYVAMMVVIVPCLFFMSLFPIVVDALMRRSQQRLAAPVVEDHRLPQAGGEDDVARDRLVSDVTGHLLNGVTKPVLVRAFQYEKSADSTLGELVETGVRDGQA